MIKEISVDEAIKMLKEDENVILLDVRAQQEYYTEHVKGSRWIPLDQIPYRLKELDKKKAVKEIWKTGERLQKETNRLLKENGLDEFITVVGKPCWQVFIVKPAYGFSDLEIKSFIQQELAQEGVLWYGQHNITLAHTKRDIDMTLRAYSRVLPKLKDALEQKTLLKQLRGETIKNIFKIR